MHCIMTCDVLFMQLSSTCNHFIVQLCSEMYVIIYIGPVYVCMSVFSVYYIKLCVYMEKSPLFNQSICVVSFSC